MDLHPDDGQFLRNATLSHDGWEYSMTPALSDCLFDTHELTSNSEWISDGKLRNGDTLLTEEF